jgi:low temperature requirement protein LtrA
MPDTSVSSTPQLRTTEKEGIRRTTWAELLNDLVFTVIVAQLAQRLLVSLSGTSLAGFFLLYIPIWWLWNGETHYSTRFDNERDVVHRSLGSLQLLGLIVLAATIPRALESNTSSIIYALTYSAIRTVLLIEYGRAWVYVPEARPYIQHITTGFGISIVIWVASAFVPAPYRYGLWAVARRSPPARTLRSVHAYFAGANRYQCGSGTYTKWL